MEASSSEHRFLTPDRIETVAHLVTPLLSEDASWIERRKESVTILDETALRRQISVDFSLRTDTDPLVARVDDGADDLFCAPVFVLPKSSGNLMAFDLEDEKQQSLRLMSRSDNAQVSGQVLICIATRVLGVTPSEGLAEQLRVIAGEPPGQGQPLADRLLTGRQPDAEVATLRGDERFCWWLTKFVSDSLVVVLFRSQGPGRKMAKLSYEEPIAARVPSAARFGWARYRVGVNSPFVEARNYHFEAEWTSPASVDTGGLLFSVLI